MFRSVLVVSTLGAALALTACSHSNQQPQQQAQLVQPAPQVVQQPQVIEQAPPQVIVQQQPQVVYAQPAYNNGAGDYAAGVVTGALLSGGGGYHTTVVHHVYTPVPVYHAAPVYVRPAPAYRSSYSSSYRSRH